MRNVVRGDIRARIVLGGRVGGYKGTMPGIAEETRISLEAGQPVFVLGGFGGCARDVAETVGLIERWSGSRDDWAGRYCFRQYSPDDLHNGLSAEENVVLARTPHIQEAVALVDRGLRDFGKNYSIFADRSVDTGDIPEEWTDQRIRRAAVRATIPTYRTTARRRKMTPVVPRIRRLAGHRLQELQSVLGRRAPSSEQTILFAALLRTM